MEISQNFGGEYFYPLNPELPGYKLETSGFTAILGKLPENLGEKPEYPGHPGVSGLKPRESGKKARVSRPPQRIRAETQRIRTILRIGQNI